VISRRHLIGSGVAASALGIGARMAKAIEAPARASAPAAFLIVDERFEAACAIASSIDAPGARYLAMPRDVLDLWHRQLAPACRHGAQAIAGVTTERGFFLLQTLAADQRLRVLSRTHHGALVSWRIGRKQG
jgi:hypothetical protein